MNQQQINKKIKKPQLPAAFVREIMLMKIIANKVPALENILYVQHGSGYVIIMSL